MRPYGILHKLYKDMESNAAALPTIPVADMNEQIEYAKQRHAQIDRIIYLASLASKPDDIEPMMDDLRVITATWDGKSFLDQSQERRLDVLEVRLKQYLIASDPLRTFTEESLNQQLASHEGRGKLGLASRSLMVILLASAIIPALSYLPFLPLSSQVRAFLAIPLFFVVLHIGISWLYLSALKNFQQDVRRAFQIICVGVVLFGLTFSHYAAISAFGLDKYPLFQEGGLSWLVSMPFMFIFFGLRIYARQAGVKSRLLSLRFLLIVTVVYAIAHFLLNSVIKGVNTNPTHIFLSVGGMLLEFSAALGAILAWKIRKIVASAYARPMTWLFGYLLFSAITGFLSGQSISSGTVDGDGMPFYLLMALAGTPVQLVLMWTGYVFKRELSR